MQKLRTLIERNPWAGWIVAALILAASIFLYRRLSGANDPYSVERLSEVVTIKCAETGDEWSLTRGEVERELRSHAGMLDAKSGLVNPKTGKPTGFLFSKSEWDRTIGRLNDERKQVIERRKSGGPVGR